MKIAEEFKKRAGGIKVIENKKEKMLYSRDIGDIPPIMSNVFFKIIPDLVVQPKNADEIKQVLLFANEKKLTVIPRGTASSGFGQVIPTDGGIVMDLATMRKIIAFDREKKTVTVQGGARWSDIDVIAKQHGLCLMTYPSSKFSTVAGWIVTGGYGINNFRYGHVSKQVLSLKVVYPKGEIRELKPADPEFNIIIGSEGQFGIVTEVTLQLKDIPENSYPRLVYFEDASSAFTFIDKIMKDRIAQKKIQPETIRFIDGDLLHEMNDLVHSDIFEKKPGVLFEFENQKDDENFLSYIASTDIKLKEAPQYVASYLWNERLFGVKTKRLGPTILMCEVIMPTKKVSAFITEAKKVGRRFGIEISSYAYIINETESMVAAEFLCDSRKLKYLINLPMIMMLTRVAVKHNARPYGLGIWFAPFINFMFDKKRLRELKEYKNKVDPNWILNRGKFFSVGSKLFGIPSLVMKPAFMNFGMSMLVGLSWFIGPVVTLLLGRNRKVSQLDKMLSTYACAKCGSCLAVCPAYLITGDEGVTPKGKVAFARRLLAGEKVTKEEADKIFLCMHCKACEEICQVNLGLVDLWETIETELENRFGRPNELIHDFLQKVDASDEYWNMVERNG